MRELAERQPRTLRSYSSPLALGIVPDELRDDLGGANVGATLVEVTASIRPLRRCHEPSRP